MGSVSILVLPFIVLFIIFYGYKKKVNIYDEFLDGAKEGLITSFRIIPNLVAMLFAINILISSNILSDLFSFLNPVLKSLELGSEIILMSLLRSVSGTSTLAIMTSIFKSYGPDSIMGLLASTIQGSSDTTLYVIALYFSSIGITKNRYALKSCLFADFCGVVASFIIVYLFFC